MAVWLTSAGILVLVSLFMKFYPKEKIIKQIDPICKLAGKSLSNFLLLKLRKPVAEKIENGLFCTLFDVIAYSANKTKEYMLEDNKRK